MSHFLSTKIGRCKNSEHTGSLHSKKLRVTTVLAKSPPNALLTVFSTRASPGPAWQCSGFTKGRGGALLPPGVGLLWKVIACIKREQARLDNRGHNVLWKLLPGNTPASGQCPAPQPEAWRVVPGPVNSRKARQHGRPQGSSRRAGPMLRDSTVHTSCHAAGKAELKDCRVRSAFYHKRRAAAYITTLRWTGSVLSKQAENGGLTQKGGASAGEPGVTATRAAPGPSKEDMLPVEALRCPVSPLTVEGCSEYPWFQTPASPGQDGIRTGSGGCEQPTLECTGRRSPALVEQRLCA